MQPGRTIAAALAAAFLFGASTPAAKTLAGELSPFLLAGLLYAGSGIGLCAWMALRRAPRVPLMPAADLPWFAAAVLCGGVIGPALLMYGLSRTAASTVALLLNLEGVFTALLAWFVFKENFDRRIALGMALIVAGGILLAGEPDALGGIDPGAAFVAGACLAWAVDNNFTRRVSGSDAVTIAAIKGMVAAVVNISIAILAGARWPGSGQVLAAGLIGFLGYGVSLALFVVALRELGAARTSAYFSTAPFVGVAVAFFVLRETPGTLFWAAAALMGAGVWLHVSERHEHEHVHEPREHAHAHVHDEHHRHAHDFDWDGTEPHSHLHRHERLVHSHPHFPDLQHTHRH
ncbi:MAG: DMT family transporter [Betaproteobacteria bacterium]|nr:DMT family transporter [Betaproteobacteria bacterium]